MRNDFFHRLPPPTALLLVASILDLTSAHILPFPRQTPLPTTTYPHHALDVVSWPLLPTPAPPNPPDLRRRQIPATVCGYIGGLSQLPVTCSAGSHCVLDTGHSVIGCCPDGEEECSSGIFTGCVDENSGPQTEVNPYVYSCSGGDVCYKNQFDGGFSQFGCGTASDLATTVLANAAGVTGSLDRQTLDDVTLTATPTPLSDLPSSSSSESSSSTSESSASSTPSSTSSATPNPSSSSPTSDATASGTTPTPAAPSRSATSAPSRTAAVVGGTVGGVAALMAVLGTAFFLYRKRQNHRQGPGNGSPTGGTYISAPKPGPGTGFTAINQNSDAYERALLPPVSTAPSFSADLTAGGPSPFAYMGAAGVHDSYPPPDRVASGSNAASYANYSYPGGGQQYPAAYAATAHGHSRLEPDQVPLTREIDDFSSGFHQALGRIGEEDEYGAAARNGGFSDELTENDNNRGGGGGGSAGQGGAVRPLWQQNRRQSRNLMWM